jgi:hypothetical protein
MRGPDPRPSPSCPETAKFVKGFGCLPDIDAWGCTEAGVRKASREETAGEFAPTVVSVYGDLAQVYAVILGFRTGTTAE